MNDDQQFFSEPVELKQGVTQGSVLGLLFYYMPLVFVTALFLGLYVSMLMTHR